eukprot:TRINITY_DN63238_c0_g1_i1.p1 TRINITY_DN63238_c0_g1~~TRINITY_DN63238_c0_g1_i1.p1  ORF type:complete len:253 (+),score=48.47 TRINITY_DN63238_c0_g1_i1:36-794(+)
MGREMQAEGDDTRIVNLGTMLMGVTIVGFAMVVAAVASDDGCFSGRHNATSSAGVERVGCGVYFCSEGVTHPKDQTDICPGRARVLDIAQGCTTIAIILHFISLVVHLMQALGCQCVLKRPLSCCPAASPYVHGVTAVLYLTLFILIIVAYTMSFEMGSKAKDVYESRNKNLPPDMRGPDPCGALDAHLDLGYAPYLICVAAVTETVAFRLARDVRSEGQTSPDDPAALEGKSCDLTPSQTPRRADPSMDVV